MFSHGTAPVRRALALAALALLALAALGPLSGGACGANKETGKVKDLNDRVRDFFGGLRGQRWLAVSFSVVPERQTNFLEYWEGREKRYVVADFTLEGVIFDVPDDPTSADVRVIHEEYRQDGVTLTRNRMVLHWVYVDNGWFLEDDKVIAPDKGQEKFTLLGEKPEGWKRISSADRLAAMQAKADQAAETTKNSDSE